MVSMARGGVQRAQAGAQEVARQLRDLAAGVT
jgi:hypothetical protein